MSVRICSKYLVTNLVTVDMVFARNERARGGVPGRRDGERQQQAEHGPCAAELQAGVVKQAGQKESEQ